MRSKAEPKKQPGAKVITIGNDTKLNDPEGVHVVESITGGQTVTLQGTIKTLRIADQFNKSTLDATLLQRRRDHLHGQPE